jgi:hypothetical protein
MSHYPDNRAVSRFYLSSMDNPYTYNSLFPQAGMTASRGEKGTVWTCMEFSMKFAMNSQLILNRGRRKGVGNIT